MAVQQKADVGVERLRNRGGNATVGDLRGLPLGEIADAALAGAAVRGSAWTSVRAHRVRRAELRLRDGGLAGSREATSSGVAVSVVLGGVAGFAARDEPTPAAAAAAARAAVDGARVLRPLAGEQLSLADEPVHREAVWRSAYETDPFRVEESEKLAVLAEWSGRLLAAPQVDHVYAKLVAVREDVFYADAAGTSALQHRVRLYPQLIAVRTGGPAVATIRTLAPPSGRGWEYVSGAGWDWNAELAAIPEWLDEKSRAPAVEPGRYDLVLDPTNLWLTLHESVGHATELDRVLGAEAGYAGTSFPGCERLGELEYGSSAMNVTADRTADHGLATVGFDDEGVAAQEWDIVRDGVLVGYQLDRAGARRLGLPRSNGCTYADSAEHVPMLRMANVSLQPAPGGPSTGELISSVEHGLYVVGDDSWSIDMQRLNFQFTGQRFYRIEHGRLAGQVRDAAYQSSTPELWHALEAVGGPETYRLMGADQCGKGQPGQLAAAGHGCPSAIFRGIRVLRTDGRA